MKQLVAPHTMQSFWARVRLYGKKTRAPGRCWDWTGARDKKGYGRLGNYLAHRLAWFLTLGEWPKDCALHVCDNPSCVRPSHLFSGSVADNNDDAARKLRCGIKLTGAQARAIRVAPGSAAAVAAKYGISRDMVYRIRHRQYWRYA